jgi:hypothetical protein
MKNELYFLMGWGLSEEYLPVTADLNNRKKGRIQRVINRANQPDTPA